MRPTRNRRFARWPFWLLLAGWLCANSPQVAVYTVLTWLAEAREFTHQRDLTRDVAFLLSGEKRESRVGEVLARTAAAQQDHARNFPSAPVPAAAVLKKLDLASEAGALLAPPLSRTGAGWLEFDESGSRRRTPPAHEPPRPALG